MILKDFIELSRFPLCIEVRKGNYKIGIFETNTRGMKEIENEIIDNWFIYSDSSRMVIDLKESIK